jgi:putative component of toxin-antitoxin plasmid stabilization module
MEIKLNDCSLNEAMEEINFHQQKGYEVYFKGRGNGEVVIIVEGK